MDRGVEAVRAGFLFKIRILREIDHVPMWSAKDGHSRQLDAKERQEVAITKNLWRNAMASSPIVAIHLDHMKVWNDGYDAFRNDGAISLPFDQAMVVEYNDRGIVDVIAWSERRDRREYLFLLPNWTRIGAHGEYHKSEFCWNIKNFMIPHLRIAVGFDGMNRLEGSVGDLSKTEVDEHFLSYRNKANFLSFALMGAARHGAITLETPTGAKGSAMRARKAGARSVEYRVARIDLSRIPPPKSESRGGTHASPRQHERRGHYRRLAGGRTVWVRPCHVGNAAAGAVVKDYVLAAGAA